MKKGREEGGRWLKQAEHNLRVAKNNLNAGFYSDACFMSEQASQVALKSYLISKTGREVREHSIQTLSKKSVKYDDDFKEIVEYGKILDRYYIPTRYPDALNSPAVPFETYIKKDAKEAVGFAEIIITLVKDKMKG
jgi:HEPN domain-containing protein